ncbi:MAG: phosphatidylinositol-specific phospholipase C [Oscillospiraceae bacterium]|nr:phosphatidylinositol-specific phospholipase C [Oscillospiraceae bacterium]
MTYRDNEVLFTCKAKGMTLNGGSYTIDSFSVTSGEDPDKKIAAGKTFTMRSNGALNFSVGRKKSSTVAQWFNARVPANKTTFGHTAGELNFAFIGRLELRFANGSAYTFKGVALAQGQSGASNNWWFGGETCSYKGSDKASCQGVDASGKSCTFTFTRGGTGNSVNEVAIMEIVDAGSSASSSPAVTTTKNEVVFEFGSGAKIASGSYTVNELKISVNKKTDVKVGQTYNLAVDSKNNEGTLAFGVDRQKTAAVAAWFNDRAPELTTTRSDAPAELNFAFVGTLTLRYADGGTYSFGGIVLAQGNDGIRNDWWFGGATCINIGNYTVDCVGVASTNAKWSFHFRRGGASGSGSNVNAIAVTRVGIGYSKNGNYPNWMGNISDKTMRLRDLSIPGTHDSATQKAPPGPARCQNADIFKQLNDGIRFFDIRLKKLLLTSRILELYHDGVTCSLNFGEVLVWCRYFLDANPDEVILMSVKQEGVSYEIDELFKKYVKACKNLFLDTKIVPTLKEGRGKIVLFNRYKTSEFGINWYNWSGGGKEEWKDNAEFDIATKSDDKFHIYDKYNFSDTPKKSAEVQSQLKSSANQANKNVFYVTFNSIAYQANTRTAYMYAWGGGGVNPAMNPELLEFLKSNTGKKRWGVVILDYHNNEGKSAKDNELVELIIKSNFN